MTVIVISCIDFAFTSKKIYVSILEFLKFDKFKFTEYLPTCTTLVPHDLLPNSKVCFFNFETAFSAHSKLIPQSNSIFSFTRGWGLHTLFSKYCNLERPIPALFRPPSKLYLGCDVNLCLDPRQLSLLYLSPHISTN